jgi:hypothetical protein
MNKSSSVCRFCHDLCVTNYKRKIEVGMNPSLAGFEDLMSMYILVHREKILEDALEAFMVISNLVMHGVQFGMVGSNLN